jgi:uncharacterized membrane protein
MQKIKVLLVALTILVITATFFQSFSMAAQVTRIHSSRKYIFINGSIADGYVMGAKVCFYSSSGEEITCGIIEQASESFARVRVDNRIAKQIRYGMEAKLSVENEREEVTTESLKCTEDSECGDSGFCIDGKCQQ